VVETVDAILDGSVKSIPQEEMAVVGELKPAPKIFKETCRIDWTRSAKQVYDFIRGLSPYPAAWTELHQPEGDALTLKVFESERIEKAHNNPVGAIDTDGKNYLHVAVSDGWIAIKSLQLPGKKRLKTDELLRGFKINNDFCVK
jgi:methionyl-tRNA formyltransferase